MIWVGLGFGLGLALEKMSHDSNCYTQGLECDGTLCY